MTTTTQDMTTNPTTGGVAAAGERAAQRTDQALVATKRAVENAAHSVETGLDSMRETVPSALTRAAAQAEDLTRRGIERAQHARMVVREKAHRTGEQTVTYIRDEPIKAVALAAMAGALAALLVSWMSRSRTLHD
jgi:ElaB/YqjD/DUF883 family membrane-anchored ribosome-binding protein